MALAIVSAALIALLRLQIMSIRVSERAERLSHATRLAEQKMAELRAVGLPELGERSGSFQDAASGVVYAWHTAVERARLSKLPKEDTGLRTVRVRVTWPDGRARVPIELESLVAGDTLP